MVAGREYLKIAEFARVWGCSESEAYKLAREGRLPVVEIAGLKRVPVAALDALRDQALREAGLDRTSETAQ